MFFFKSDRNWDADRVYLVPSTVLLEEEGDVSFFPSEFCVAFYTSF